MVAVTDTGTTYWILGTSIGISDYRSQLVANNLSPEESLSIDTKLDDGNPATGIVQVTSSYDGYVLTAGTGGATNCIFTGGTEYNTKGTYTKGKLCTLRIQGNF